MPTKTERILSYLPTTFRALPPPTALHSFVDAFGRELLVAENTLAEVMQAHWVDHADKGSDLVRDLERFAALYGLASRPEEEVEEFREHLKRYVRTFLEGTVTVQGILRVTAEALALHIDDRYSAMDTWWTRPTPRLVTVRPVGADAASLVLGADEVSARGADAAPASMTGTVDLSRGADLRSGSMLRVTTESGSVEVDLAAGAPDPGAVTLDHMVAALQPVATVSVVAGRYLRLSSSVTGPGSTLSLDEGLGDAAETVLGLPPRTVSGGDATAAVLTGLPLDGGVDLGDDERFVRVSVDGPTREIDLGTGHKSLDELRDAFDDAFGAPVASHDGAALTLTSGTTGQDGTVWLQRAAAQDAGPLLFGATDVRRSGRDEQPAFLSGRRDLSAALDLSAASTIRLRIDGATRTIEVAGGDPAATSRSEVISALNDAFGADVASVDGYSIAVASPTPGAAGEVALEDVPNGDAAPAVFGLPPRAYRGNAERAARVAGPALGGSVDMMARHLLGIAVDGGPVQAVDLRRDAADPRAVTVAEIVAAVNDQAGPGLAADGGDGVILTSPTSGGGSSIEVQRLTESRARAYVTRAAVTDEASQALFGFVAGAARGTEGTAAALAGTVDVARGVDLSAAAYLRLAVDGGPFVDVHCAGPRPRATLLDEVVASVNAVFPSVAVAEGSRLTLRSPAEGDASSIALDLPRPGIDLLGLEPGLVRGTDPSGVRLVSTVDLHDGVDLPDGAAVTVGFDGGAPVDVALTPAGGARVGLGEIANRINVALGAGIADHDPARLILSSPTAGAASSIEVAVPGATDVTEEVFGFAAPRSYHGRDATPAVVTGTSDLAGTHDVRSARRIALGIDGAEPVEIDVGATAADAAHATLGDVVAAIEAVLPGIASEDGGRLVLTSTSSGSASRIDVQPAPSDDARSILLGPVDPVARGSAAVPAVLTGEVEVSETVDLSDRSLVRISIDGGEPLDVDVAGLAPWATSAGEAAGKLDAALEATAEVTPEGRVRVTSATAGTASSVSIHPLRHLELVEFPPGDTRGSHGPTDVRHGDAFSVLNDGVAEEPATIAIRASAGVAGPSLVNESQGWEVRVGVALAPGSSLEVAPSGDGGVRAVHTHSDGIPRAVPPGLITVGPPGAVARVPFDGRRAVPVTLDDPTAPAVVVMRRSVAPGATIEVRAASGSFPNAPVFDVVVHGPAGEHETYAGVTIGRDPADHRSLTRQIEERASSLLTAEQQDKSTVLRLRPGRSAWRYLDCDVARFDATRFDHGVFGVGPCGERGVFGISRFVGAGEAGWWAGRAVEPVRVTAGDEDWDVSLFDSASAGSDAVAQVSFSWRGRMAGTFEVNLPADLHPRFGARFNGARFAKPGDEPETFVAAVTEPDDDERFLGTLIMQGHPGPGDAAVPASDLVTASVEPRVPLGWSPVPMPFRKPRRLTLGGAGSPARIFLTEEGLGGRFLQIEAKEEGTWGNDISVSARKSGPARFDVTISLQAARFENARAAVLGDPPPVRAADLAGASRVGLLQAKAAGVRASATRDGSTGTGTPGPDSEGRRP